MLWLADLGFAAGGAAVSALGCFLDSVSIMSDRQIDTQGAMSESPLDSEGAILGLLGSEGLMADRPVACASVMTERLDSKGDLC